MKKVLFAIMAIVLCVGLIGGAFAYFSDTQASTGNTFTAGNVWLEMANSSGVYSKTNAVFATVGNMAPGHEVGPYNVGFKNAGSIGGVVTATMTYDRTAASADAFAQKLIVSFASVDGSSHNIAPYWAEQIADTAGWSWATAIANNYIVASSDPGLDYPYLPTVYGLQTVVLHFSPYLGPSTFTDLTFAAGVAHYETLKIKLDPTAVNNLENIGITVAVNGLLTSN